jgi:hypothetical protein
MIPLRLAQDLKQSGLIWRTDVHDFFAIPDRGMDDKAFVLTDVMATVELLQGWPVVAFHGAAEWALDHIFTSEVVWLPTEAQLRDLLDDALGEGGHLTLQREPDGYGLSFDFDGPQSFRAPTAGEAYGAGLLHVLRAQNGAVDV